MAEALYRKYRPQTFDSLVGQGHIERTLKNAIEQDKVSHAYLFCGPRGTGKTTMARLLAKALLCEHGPTATPDGTCPECVQIAEGTHPDVYELDAASRTGVDNVREEIIARVQYAPTRGSRKIYIIDEVHMLSTPAFNALLKTLEEPPAHVVFILCTTDPQKVPETIHSRCQRFDFHRLSTDEIVSRLGAVCVAEDVDFEGEALELIAHRAEGGMRNALTSLEQLIAFGEGHVTVAGAEDLLGSLDSSDMAEIVMAIGRRDPAACFEWIARYVETGADLVQFTRDMAEHMRDMYVLQIAGDDVALDITDQKRRELIEEAPFFGPERCSRMMQVLGETIAELRTAGNQRLCFEIACTRMVRPDSDYTLASLAERIEALESGYSAVALPVAAAAAPVRAAEPVFRSEPEQEEAEEPREADGALEVEKRSVEMESQPVAATSQPASADMSTLLGNPAALQRAWKVALADIKKTKAAYGAFFINVKARPSDDGQSINLVFPADSDFTFNAVQKPDVQELVYDAFARATGAHVQVACVKEDRSDQGQSFDDSRSVVSEQPHSQQLEQRPTQTMSVSSAQQVNSVRPAVEVQQGNNPQSVAQAQSANDDRFAAGVDSHDAVPAFDDSRDFDDVSSQSYGSDPAEMMDYVPYEDEPMGSAIDDSFEPDASVQEAGAAPSAASQQVQDAEQQDFSQILSSSMGQTITFHEVEE